LSTRIRDLITQAHAAAAHRHHYHYFNSEGIAGSAFIRHHIVDLTVVVAPHPTSINSTTLQRVREAFACSSPTSGTKQHHIITTIHRYPSL
jgi:hypothetical protein